MTIPTDPKVPSEQVPSASRREEVMALWRKYHCPYYYGFLEPIWPFIAALDAQSAERTRAEAMGSDETVARVDADIDLRDQPRV